MILSKWFVNNIHFNTLSDLLSFLTNPSNLPYLTKFTHVHIWFTEFIPVKLVEEGGEIKIQGVDVDAVSELILTHAPAVSAYCRHGGVVRAVIDEWGTPVSREHVLNWAPYVPVYATSSDFLLIDTRVLRELVNMWNSIPNPPGLADDYLITYKLRKLGYEPILNVNVVCLRVVEELKLS